MLHPDTEVVIFVGEQLELLTWDVLHTYAVQLAEVYAGMEQWELTKAQHFALVQLGNGHLQHHLWAIFSDQEEMLVLVIVVVAA